LPFLSFQHVVGFPLFACSEKDKKKNVMEAVDISRFFLPPILFFYRTNHLEEKKGGKKSLSLSVSEYFTNIKFNHGINMYHITFPYIFLLFLTNYYHPIYNSIIRSSIYYIQTPSLSICNTSFVFF
jgi:hypothetical protein